MTVIPIEVAHFWAKVEIGGTAQCWRWTGARKGRGGGYGKFREHLAHRYAYQLHRGAIEDGVMIRHMCGNKLCVNPSHLEPGSAKDNYDDRFRLGEGTGGIGGRGSSNSRSKLNEAEARYIIENPDKLTGRQLARKFSVSPATICLIRKGARWAHVA